MNYNFFGSNEIPLFVFMTSSFSKYRDAGLHIIMYNDFG